MLAQLALGLVSAQHQARMLATTLDAGVEICTPDGVQYISLGSPLGEAPAGEDTARLAGGMQCAVCAAALLDPLPTQAQRLAASMAATERLLPPKALAQPTATPDLLPPPRAPPVQS
ncbi:hypothetical protein B4966_08465 [Rhodocyclaceae bacterium]|nr:hypothetical protein B4966_08465 [Rhodocyclaceae bacterium]